MLGRLTSGTHVTSALRMLEARNDTLSAATRALEAASYPASGLVQALSRVQSISAWLDELLRPIGGAASTRFLDVPKVTEGLNPGGGVLLTALASNATLNLNLNSVLATHGRRNAELARSVDRILSQYRGMQDTVDVVVKSTLIGAWAASLAAAPAA